MARIQHVSTFIATDDSGAKHKLHVFQEWVSAATFADPSAEVEGLRSIEMDDGTPVNYKSKGVYETYIGMPLRSTGPNAP